MRIGFGYDVHRLVEGRKLILGGVEIPFSLGLLGHSDADVLTHALMDALLGAAALGDIGKHFPDHDPKYKDISSLLLLGEVNKLLKQKGYSLNNADLLIVAEKPKLAPFMDKIGINMAKALGVEIDKINIKATTTEGLGFAGTGAGMAAHAVVTICN